MTSLFKYLPVQGNQSQEEYNESIKGITLGFFIDDDFAPIMIYHDQYEREVMVNHVCDSVKAINDPLLRRSNCRGIVTHYVSTINNDLPNDNYNGRSGYSQINKVD